MIYCMGGNFLEVQIFADLVGTFYPRKITEFCIPYN